MRRTAVAAWMLTLTASWLMVAPIAQADTVEPHAIVAELDGIPIPAYEVGDHFCHDFDFPTIRCYSTATELEELAVGTAIGDELAGAANAAGDYVTVYSDPSYAGTYAHLSQNYDALWVIGWNDRISSFKVRNSASGSFHADWYAGGRRYDFCCSSSVPYLSSTYENTFSSVYRG